jgi:hypothetical protein
MTSKNTAFAAVAAIALPLTLASSALATVLYDSSAATNGGSETATTTNWLTASFTTDATAYTAIRTTLTTKPAAATSSVTLGLYSDADLEPDSLVATFESTSTPSTSAFTATTFQATRLALAASTKYWLVYKTTSGSFEWAYTNDYLVTGEWGTSTDSGATWFTSDAYPFLFSATGLIATAGDTNLDGSVNFTDLVALAQNYNLAGTWSKGDFDGTGTVEFADLVLLAQNYSAAAETTFEADWALAQALAPEPIALLSTIAALPLLALRRRRA